MLSDLPKSIGVYGGSFDPVHFGHLRCALEVRRQLGLDELRFIPSGDPPHKADPRASASDRIKMLDLAIARSPGLIIDSREIERKTTSYTIDTLEEIKNEYPDASLTLVIGTDQFSVFDTWHRWQAANSYRTGGNGATGRATIGSCRFTARR